MKRIGALIGISLLGVVLLLLNRPIESGVNTIFFHQQIRLSEAFRYLEEGKMQDHEKALRDYLLADKNGSKKLRALALYNLGSCSLARTGPEDPNKDALFYFKEALRNDPSLFPAKFNLEILLRKFETSGNAQEKPKTEKPLKFEGEEQEEKGEGLTVSPPTLGGNP